MQQLTLTTVTVGSFQENCYLLSDPNRNACIVVDPGAEADKLLQQIGNRRVTAILLTHAHHDHIGAVEEIRTKTGAPVRINPAERDLLAPIRADGDLNNGDTIMLGAHTLRAVHTPGHTPGMISLWLTDGRALVGDTIFAGGPGRTWSAADFRTMLQTLHTILTWPDATVCYPGHGPSFGLGAIRTQIEAFLARDHPAEFYGDAEW